MHNCNYINWKVCSRLRAVSVEAEDDCSDDVSCFQIKSVGQWRWVQEVTEISEVSQSISHLSSYFFWLVGAKFIAASNPAEACSFHIHWVAFHIQHTRNRKVRQNTLFPIYLRLAVRTVGHTAITNRENTRVVSGYCSAFHILAL